MGVPVPDRYTTPPEETSIMAPDPQVLQFVEDLSTPDPDDFVLADDPQTTPDHPDQTTPTGVVSTEVKTPGGAVVPWAQPVRRGPVEVTLTAVRAIGTVARHETTATVVRAVVRHGAYPIAGAGVVLARVRDATTAAPLHRQIKVAELTGQTDRIGELHMLAIEAKARRHERIMEWLHIIPTLLRLAVVWSAVLPVLLLVLGITMGVANHDAGLVLAPVKGVYAATGAVWACICLVAAIIGAIGPWVTLVVLHHIGRTKGTVPAWVATADELDVGADVDENAITRALGALKIPAIRAQLKADIPLTFITTARRDGRGTHAVVRLPAGVTAMDISARRGALASGLCRSIREVWVTTGHEEGILDLWVADKGALSEGAGPYPLLTEGAVDIFKGLPVGKTLRGEPVDCPMMERNTLVAGQPGQGKSAFARVLTAGASLDPTVELRIWVPDENFDFDAFKPRCSSLIVGAETADFEAIMVQLRRLDEEVQERGELLRKHKAEKVTRKLASAGIGLHPLVCLLEEAHMLFTHPEFGEEAGMLAVNIVRLGRKRGIHLIVSTQSPTAKSLPSLITMNCSNGIAFHVKDPQANDRILGAGSHKAGIRATELIPGTDRGTALAVGIDETAKYVTLQTYYISPSKGSDQITPIIKRAMAAIKDAGGVVPGSGTARPAVEPRDLLADLLAVLPTGETTRAALAAGSLGTRWRGEYGQLTGRGLVERLETDHGYKVPSTGNAWPLDPAVLQALGTPESS
jgi:S-DNA-T family DNA segregation ATPase FtsK/SpoIIIE